MWVRGVPHGWRVRDSRVFGLVTYSWPLWDAGSCLVALPFDGAVDRGSTDPEELSDLGGAVVPAVQLRDQMCLLAAVELRLLAAEAAVGLRDSHAFAGAEPDQVGLELRDHRQHVEQQWAHGVGRVVQRPADA